MKAFVLKEPGVVGWAEVPDPVLTPYGAILKPVAVAPCSSDVHTVFGGGSRKAPTTALYSIVNQLDTARRFMWNKVTRVKCPVDPASNNLLEVSS